MSVKQHAFAQRLLDWQALHGRHDLPWQNTGRAYCVWLSEVMLQQTQVSTVIEYYRRFLDRFPTIDRLAEADEDEVMQMWQGLGYYTRARNLHACAKAVVSMHGGEFPANLSQLEALPGIGRSTAGAIASLGLGMRAPILDGNVKRVFARHWAIDGAVDQAATQKKLWLIAEQELSEREVGRYNQALMDLGAMVCKRGEPACGKCPVALSCEGLKQGRVYQLPTPKTKKHRPNWFFLALMSQRPNGTVWLQQRPDEGLWRRLWMPPLINLGAADAEQVLGAIQALTPAEEFFTVTLREQAEARAADPNNWIVHELTHRKIHVLPLFVDHGDVPIEHFRHPEQVALPALTTKLLAWLNHMPMAKQNTLDLG